jgi:hypothetical protein
MNYLLVRRIIHSKNHPSVNQKMLPLRNIASPATPAGNKFSRPKNLNRWDIMSEGIR